MLKLYKSYSYIVTLAKAGIHEIGAKTNPIPACAGMTKAVGIVFGEIDR